MRNNLAFVLDEVRRIGAGAPLTALVDQFYERCRGSWRSTLGHVVARLAPQDP